MRTHGNNSRVLHGFVMQRKCIMSTHGNNSRVLHGFVMTKADCIGTHEEYTIIWSQRSDLLATSYKLYLYSWQIVKQWQNSLIIKTVFMLAHFISNTSRIYIGSLNCAPQIQLTIWWQCAHNQIKILLTCLLSHINFNLDSIVLSSSNWLSSHQLNQIFLRWISLTICLHSRYFCTLFASNVFVVWWLRLRFFSSTCRRPASRTWTFCMFTSLPVPLSHCFRIYWLVVNANPHPPGTAIKCVVTIRSNWGQVKFFLNWRQAIHIFLNNETHQLKS